MILEWEQLARQLQEREGNLLLILIYDLKENPKYKQQCFSKILAENALAF